MKTAVLATTFLVLTALAAPALSATAPSVPGARALPASLSPLAAKALDLGIAPASLPIHVVVGLDLRNAAALDSFIASASDPASPDFQHFLTEAQFDAQFAPTDAQEQRVVDWLTASGFTVSDRFPNHILVGAYGTAGAAQAAFGVPVHVVLLDGALHYSALAEPKFPSDIAAFTTGVTGLDDLTAMHPMTKSRASVPPAQFARAPTPTAQPDASAPILASPVPLAAVGGTCCSFGPGDLKTFYDNGGAQTGSGQTIVIAGAYAWLSNDVSGFDTQFGLPALPAASAQVCTGPLGLGPGCQFDVQNSIEISLDVEYAHGTAPAAVIKNYMSGTTLLSDFQTMYNRVVTDNPGHTVSTSWGTCEAGQSASSLTTQDNTIKAGNAKGQSWFAASGDFGSDDCQNSTASPDSPASSPHVMGVGGTAAVCSSGMTSADPACHGYASETAWSGSGGGASGVFAKPAFQTGCGVPADGKRDVPDVSLEADPAHYGNWVLEAQLWFQVGGTSDAAPQWGGFFSELNQKKGGAGLGLPGARIYALCGGTSYHDITSGSNGAFSAHAGYDQVTGVGTIDAANLLANY
ncbi:MAG: S53 family peptidase [Thermoplasmatota archaeon]